MLLQKADEFQFLDNADGLPMYQLRPFGLRGGGLFSEMFYSKTQIKLARRDPLLVAFAV